MKKLFAIVIAMLLAVTAVPALAAGMLDEGIITVEEQGTFFIEDVDFEDPVNPGSTLSVEVVLRNTETLYRVEDVELKAWLTDAASGERVTDKALVAGFPVNKDSDTTKTVKITIPSDLAEGSYNVQIEASGRWDGTGPNDGRKVTTSATQVIEVEQLDDSLFVSELRFTKDTYKSGETVDAAVTVMNNGKEDLDRVQVTISVPQLDIVKTLTLFGTLFAGAEQTVYFTFQLPEDASGIFNVKATASNTLATSTVSKVLVVSDAAATIDTSKMSNAQISKELVVGKEEIISMQVSNKGTVTKQYSVSASAESGLNVMVEPKSFSLAPGASRTVLVHVTALETGTSSAAVNVVEGNTAVAELTINTETTQGFTQNTGLFLLAVLAIVGIVLYMQYKNPQAEKKTLYY